MYDYVQCCDEVQCLVSGQVPRALVDVLPYIARLDPGHPLTTLWQSEGLGRNWGIELLTRSPIKSLRMHFKKFLSARLPDGRVTLFRFYDPRVFRTYLLAASAIERRPWFLHVERYHVGGAAPGHFHDFWLCDDGLCDGDASV